MLKSNYSFNYQDGAVVELEQCLDEGKNVLCYSEEAREIDSMSIGSPERLQRLHLFLDKLACVSSDDALRRSEPNELENIRSIRPVYRKTDPLILSADKLYDKVYGAWLGRCAGCLLGKPLEGMTRSRILGISKDTNNYPFNYYVSTDVSEEILARYDMMNHWAGLTYINYMKHAPMDDDTDFTIMGLRIIKEYGTDFLPEDVAEAWLQNFPILRVCTAETVAYMNIVNKIYPPLSALFRNPYREWIGAQIRADIYGYITPGEPEMGAELAWRDASISHVRNGIYGAMFVAAMLSTAYSTPTIKDMIYAGLSQIPEHCRLSMCVQQVMEWKQKGLHWERAIDMVHSLFDENARHHAVHVIPNAMIVVLAILYGEMDFEKTISTAALSGFDTDCNGATAGSILGLLLGKKGLPSKWIDPLNDLLDTGIPGYDTVRISELAKDTVNAIPVHIKEKLRIT